MLIKFLAKKQGAPLILRSSLSVFLLLRFPTLYTHKTAAPFPGPEQAEIRLPTSKIKVSDLVRSD